MANKKPKNSMVVPATMVLSVLLIGVSFGAGAFWTQLKLDSKAQTNTNSATKATEQEKPLATNATIEKSEKPKVELFVMSHCPYGTQIEKGILPVLETLGDNIEFTLKFCSYAMHGEKELQEQLRQYCIQKEEPNNLLAYLTCFLKEGNSENCVAATNIDTENLVTCITTTDTEYEVISNYADKSTWLSGAYPLFDVHKTDNEDYGIKGSPGLVINGTVASNVSRDPASLLSTICNAFDEKPEECNTTVSSDVPAPGFGEGTVSNSNTTGCTN
jgi:hypothetical protein